MMSVRPDIVYGVADQPDRVWLRAENGSIGYIHKSDLYKSGYLKSPMPSGGSMGVWTEYSELVGQSAGSITVNSNLGYSLRVSPEYLRPDEVLKLVGEVVEKWTFGRMVDLGNWRVVLDRLCSVVVADGEWVLFGRSLGKFKWWVKDLEHWINGGERLLTAGEVVGYVKGSGESGDLIVMNMCSGRVATFGFRDRSCVYRQLHREVYRTFEFEGYGPEDIVGGVYEKIAPR